MAELGPIIYAIRNLLNGKRYIGSTTNAYHRYFDHLSLLRRNKHKSVILQRAWNKYGENAFVFEVVEFTPRDKIIEREQYWLNLHPEYNCSFVAGPKTRLGMKSSSEHRANQSRALKGRAGTMKGKKFSVEHRQRISLSRKGKGRPFGYSHTEETKKKISQKHRPASNSEKSEETREKHRANAINWWNTATPEQKERRLKGLAENMEKSRLGEGVIVTPQQINKMYGNLEDK